MKGKYYIILAVLMWSMTQQVSAQTTFYNTYGHTTEGGEGRNAVQAADGGYFLTYYFYEGSKFITCLTKLNCAGVKEWDKKFDCGYTTMPVDLIPQTDNGCLFTLSIRRNADWEATVMRLDANGNQLWATSFPMHIAGVTGCTGVSPGGYIFVCGGITAPSGTTGTGIAKLQPNGQLLWLKQYYDFGYHTPVALTITPSDRIAVVSTAGFSTLPFSNLTVMLCDNSGNFMKRKVFGTYYDDDPKSVCSDEQGNIYITGQSYFLGSEWDAMFLKLNGNLDVLESKFYNAGTAQGEQTRYIIKTQNGIAMFGDEGGFNERNPMIVNMDRSGNILWAKSYPVSPAFTNYAFYGSQCKDGGFLWTGDVRPPSQYRFAPIMKTDMDGDAGCFTANLNLSERTELMTVLDTALLVYTTNYIANAQILPEVTMPSSETVFCSHVFPCGNFTKTGEVCPGVCYTYEDHSLNATTWQWTFENGTPANHTGKFPPEVCYDEEGMHKVTLELTNNAGTTIYTQYVNGTPDCPIVVPNIFSPNNDSINDLFAAIHVKEPFSLEIYNRWGTIIFSADYPGTWWNGKTNSGTKAADGVYFYVLKLKESGKEFQGTVTLVR